MRAKSLIQFGAIAVTLFLSLAQAKSVEAQARHLQHTVTVQVPSVVKIIPDPAAVGPTGLPILRVVSNDPAVRRRFEQENGGTLVAEALAAGPTRNTNSAPDFRFTVVAP